MFKKTLLISGVVALLTITASARGYYNGDDYEYGHYGHNGHSKHGYGHGHGHRYNSNGYRDINNSLVTSQQVVELTQEQKDDLLFMVEEEKLARDVYLYLYDLWGNSIFNNISNSEQRHMDAIGYLINRYGLKAPVTLNSRGEFQNQELQELYNTLIEKGKTSLIDALEVGVAIEEKDIADLEERLEANPPEDFTTTYQNLLNGSYNHLNAFNRQLGR